MIYQKQTLNHIGQIVPDNRRTSDECNIVSEAPSLQRSRQRQHFLHAGPTHRTLVPHDHDISLSTTSNSLEAPQYNEVVMGGARVLTFTTSPASTASMPSRSELKT